MDQIQDYADAGMASTETGRPSPARLGGAIAPAHGINLRAGDNTYSRLKHLCEAMGNPIAEQFKPEIFAEYRARRLKEGISASNLNREHSARGVQ